MGTGLLDGPKPTPLIDVNLMRDFRQGAEKMPIEVIFSDGPSGRLVPTAFFRQRRQAVSFKLKLKFLI